MPTQANPLYLGLGLTPAECVEKFKAFYTNEAIRQLAKWPRWAVSHPTEKAPISMYGLAMTPPLEYFASCNKPRDMLPLHKVLLSMPDLSNSAMYLDGHECGYAIVDIEKKCPKKVREKLLAMPWHYAERSLSGKGIHLIIDFPQNLIDKNPNADKAKVQDSADTYEILLKHWVTFTRNVIDPTTVPQRGTMTIEECLSNLFEKQKKAISCDVNFDVTDPEAEIPDYEDTVDFACAKMSETYYDDILDKKNRDDSKADFEFARQSALAVTRSIEQMSPLSPEEYEPSHVALMTKQVMKHCLEEQGVWREKYDSARNDMNYLEMTIANACDFVLRTEQWKRG